MALGFCDADRDATLNIDLSSQPDIAQTIVVTACLTGRPFRIGGLHTLRIKETDRLEALRAQLAQLGFNIEIADDSILSWDGAAGEAAASRGFSPTTTTVWQWLSPRLQYASPH